MIYKIYEIKKKRTLNNIEEYVDKIKLVEIDMMIDKYSSFEEALQGIKENTKILTNKTLTILPIIYVNYEGGLMKNPLKNLINQISQVNIFTFNERLQKQKENYEFRIRELEKSHEKEIKQLQRSIDTVLPKFVKIEAERLPQDRDFRIYITLSERQLQEGLLWGNDEKFIEAIAYDIGQRALHTIKHINSFR